MKVIKWIIGIALGLALLFCIIGWCLRGRYHVERSVSIKAPPERIHPSVSRLEEWPKWTAWTVAKYPDMKISYSGPSEGVGAKYEWEGESVGGHGELTITESEPAKGIKYAMAFEQMPLSGGIRYEPTGDTTKVTWFTEGELGMNPISRYFGLLMDSMMGPDFETGLANLKQRVEMEAAKPAEARTPSAEGAATKKPAEESNDTKPIETNPK
jgi:polyketide cyclase/dehydrase/lipid transport protein